MEKGVIILCGGKSTRMGRDKATLPFGPERMLQRVIRRLSEVVDLRHIVVVASVDQDLPDIPAQVTLAFDRQPERGPLEGLKAGLQAIDPSVEAVFATSCDVPLLVPGFVERMFELLGPDDIAAPRDDQRCHPLAAVYRTSALIVIQQLLDANRLRMRDLFEQVKTREIPIAELRDVDPQLGSLQNLNHPEDYQRAMALAGFLDNVD